MKCRHLWYVCIYLCSEDEFDEYEVSFINIHNLLYSQSSQRISSNQWHQTPDLQVMREFIFSSSEHCTETLTVDNVPLVDLIL